MEKDIETIRHSLSHVLAMAVLEMFPEAKLGIGPAIGNGFYYDFELPRPLVPEDLPKLEKRMREIINSGLEFEQEDISKDEADKLFKDQPYKLELINDLPGPDVSIYKLGKGSFDSQASRAQDDGGIVNFVDLCAGPHVDSTKELKEAGWKLDKTAGAYWRGSEKNKMLQRIYGLAFENKGQLDDYIKNRQEAEKRDHRKLGKELELFILSDEVGAGLPIWLPKGAQLRENLQNFLRRYQVEAGYKPVITPHIAKESLFKTSGHVPHYLESMFNPMEIDNEKYYLKPVNCPMHIQVYKNGLKSYRDLPIRTAEFGTVYRYEKSGELNGLTRVRMITQDDAHIFCRPDQLQAEFLAIVELIKEIFEKLNFTDYRARVGLRSEDKKEKYLGGDEVWQKAEADVCKACDEAGIEYAKEEGDAAIYGPKLDFVVKDVIGREWQLGTIQVDYNLPERFDMTYIDEDGKEQRPVMIHRAPFGSLERFIGILIEHFGGAFPAWLAPVQVVVLPIAERHLEYTKKIEKTLSKAGVRVEVDERNESIGKKIRESEMQKIPFMLVIGDKEMASGKVAVRKYGQGQAEGGEADKSQMDISEIIHLVDEDKA